jgi:hypothetical protein
MEILKERLSQTKTWFDYKVTSEKKFRLIYNWKELKVDLKWWPELIETAKLIIAILNDYKKQWFDKKLPKFYEKRWLDWFSSDLKVDNNIFLEDYHVTQWEWISKKMWSNLDVTNAHFANNVQWKMEYNTKALAEFLNSIVKDFK